MADASLRQIAALMILGASAFAQNSAHPVLFVTGANSVVSYDGVTGVPRGVFAKSDSKALLGMAFGPDKNLYVLSCNSESSILQFNGVNGSLIRRFASVGGCPTSAVFGPDGHLYEGNWWDTETQALIKKFNGRTGEFMGDFALGVALPWDLTFGPDRNLYVSSSYGNSILKFDGKTGEYLGEFVSGSAGGLRYPIGLTFDLDGHLYVSSNFTNSILKFDGTSGAFIAEFVRRGSGGLDDPRGLTFGPNGNLYVASHGTDSVLEFDGKTGAFIRCFAAGGGLKGPNFVAFEREMTIVNYKVVSTQMAAGGRSSMAYQADLVNPGPVVSAVIATLESLDPFAIRVVPGQEALKFGAVGTGGRVTSKNTFTVIADPDVPLDISKLRWTFRVWQPPVPDAGPDRTVAVGSTVILDGTGSMNPSGTGTMTYTWEIGRAHV